MYFENEIRPLLKGVQTFKNNNQLWVQYDIKLINGQDVAKIYNYIKSKYQHVYPRIQRLGDKFIGDIQFVDTTQK